jgi:predicted nucleotidyltransferase
VANVPRELSALLRSIATDFPAILEDNLVGIYLWGSLTYDAFDKRCSDVDSIVVTRKDLDDAEFTALERWFRLSARRNRWTRRLEMRFVIDREFLDMRSRCCGFYAGKFARHGSDGNPIIWMNISECGKALWGKDAREIAPAVSDRRLNDALLLELDYLSEDLAKNAGSRSDRAFRHNAYAVLTTCRILYTARHRSIVAKDVAYNWAIASLPTEWRPVVAAARRNHLRNHGATTNRLEQDAAGFVGFVRQEVKEGAGRQEPDPTGKPADIHLTHGARSRRHQPPWWKHSPRPTTPPGAATARETTLRQPARIPLP